MSETPTPEVAPAADGMTDAVRAAVDTLLGETPAKQAEPEVQAQAEGAKDEAPPATPAAAAPPPAAAPPDEHMAELRAFASAQARWARDREQLAAKATSAADEARRQIITALGSDDPDAALADLGLPTEARQAIARRLVLRHVPADKAPPELRPQIEADALRAEVRGIKKQFEEYVQKQTEGRERERQETQAQQAAQAALQTLHDAFRSAGDDLRYVRGKYGKRPYEAVRDAIEVGKEMTAAGEISTRMSNDEIARRLVAKLNARYAEDFGLSAPPPAAAPAPANGKQKAAEGHAARTITREASAVTRPPPAPGPRRPEEEELREMAADMARLKREGKL